MQFRTEITRLPISLHFRKSPFCGNDPISAPRVGPAHEPLEKPFKTGFRFWLFFLHFLLCLCIPVHSLALLCGVISGHGEKATKNHIWPGSQHSGRVGKRSNTNFKAEIALDNIPTNYKARLSSIDLQFHILCPTRTPNATQPPPNPA